MDAWLRRRHDVLSLSIYIYMCGMYITIYIWICYISISIFVDTYHFKYFVREDHSC